MSPGCQCNAESGVVGLSGLAVRPIMDPRQTLHQRGPPAAARQVATLLTGIDKVGDADQDAVDEPRVSTGPGADDCPVPGVMGRGQW